MKKNWEGGRENDSPYLGRDRRKPDLTVTLQAFCFIGPETEAKPYLQGQYCEWEL